MGGQSFRCPLCERWTLNPRALRDHLRGAHGLVRCELEFQGPHVTIKASEPAPAGRTRPERVMPKFDYAPHPGHRCPSCLSPAPHLHPAVQCEGEVQLCTNDYHLVPTNQNRPEIIAEVKAAAEKVDAR